MEGGQQRVVACPDPAHLHRQLHAGSGVGRHWPPVQGGGGELERACTEGRGGGGADLCESSLRGHSCWPCNRKRTQDREEGSTLWNLSLTCKAPPTSTWDLQRTSRAGGRGARERVCSHSWPVSRTLMARKRRSRPWSVRPGRHWLGRTGSSTEAPVEEGQRYSGTVGGGGGSRTLSGADGAAKPDAEEGPEGGASVLHTAGHQLPIQRAQQWPLVLDGGPHV